MLLPLSTLQTLQRARELDRDAQLVAERAIILRRMRQDGRLDAYIRRQLNESAESAERTSETCLRVVAKCGTKPVSD